MLEMFATKVTDEWGTSYSLTPAGYTLLILAMIAFLLMACFVSGKDAARRFSTKKLVFSAMAIALSMVTSLIKLWDLPMGGSVTLFSMLFISLIGSWYGLRTGLMAAIAYGFLQLIVDPYIISLQQMCVDYLFAFGSLGLSGLFYGSKSRYATIYGYLAGVLGRYFFSFLSGMIFFGTYAAEFGMSAPVYSLVYNGTYLGAEAVLTIIVLLLPPMAKAVAHIRQLAVS